MQTLYRNVIEPTERIPLAWTGTLGSCDPGATSQAYRDAVFQRINWFRGMAGVPAGIVSEDTNTSKAAKAALMMSANGQLNHFPPSNWTCYSGEGAEAAGKSNLCFRPEPIDTGCVAGYMRDWGGTNAPVGHRRWILYPQSQSMSTGDVDATGGAYPANALWVVPAVSLPRPATRDPFVAWPPKGFVPYQTVYPRWSFSLTGADFASAAVSMFRGASPVPANIEHRGGPYGESTLVWAANNLNPTDYAVNWPKPQGEETIHVTISNVVVNGTPQSFDYDVVIFDPGSGGCAFQLGPPSPLAAPATGLASHTVSVTTQSGCEWFAATSASWISLTGPTAGSGPGSVKFAIASNPTTTARSGSVQIAGIAYVVNQAAASLNSAQPPRLASFTPRTGSGMVASVTAQFEDPDGIADIDVVNLLINSALDGRSACYLAYNRASNILYLVNDGGNGLLPGLILNGQGSLSNGACTIQGNGTSAKPVGNVLELKLAILYQPSFQGDKVVYVAGRDKAGKNSGWLTAGVWRVPEPAGSFAVESLQTRVGSGTYTPVTAVIRYPAAAANITNAQLLINGDLNGNQACYVGFVIETREVYLVKDEGPAAGLLGPLHAGTGGTLANSQCRITAPGISISGADLTLTVGVDALGSFRGSKLVYAAAQRIAGSAVAENTGWRPMGIWNIP
ncbi:MAG: BACON domain-containing carbohydrate-binding protein [Bryobacteraceae bacterium]